MQSLADVQSSLRNAVVKGDFPPITALLLGGGTAEHRLAIHRRHYQTSLIKALLDKFPATIWLVGSQFVTEAAGIFIAQHPPGAPCIAEYGEDFPAFLATCQGADRVPYLREFAQLEWHVGQVAIAVDKPPTAIEEFSKIPADLLPDVALILQTGLRYIHASWPVNELMQVYLAKTRPDHLEFAPAEACLEIRGARGKFCIDRLGSAGFIFRKSISKGGSIGDAAEEALDAGADFEPGRALVKLVAGGLVTAIAQPAARREQ